VDTRPRLSALLGASWGRACVLRLAPWIQCARLLKAIEDAERELDAAKRLSEVRAAAAKSQPSAGRVAMARGRREAEAAP
jgi:hypothetical protein